MLTKQMRELERQATVVNQPSSTSNYVVSYKTADGEIGILSVTGEDHVDAEANFYMIADDNGWAVDEVVSVSVVAEFTDNVYEMEDHDNWLDQYVKVHY
jgi:hypothetical protein